MGEWNGVDHMGGRWIWWINGILIIAAFAWAILGSSTRNIDSGVSAEELLKRRFARGEISKEDYEKALQDLKPGRQA
jgi:uncharacterized membrane protein